MVMVVGVRHLQQVQELSFLRSCLGCGLRRLLDCTQKGVKGLKLEMIY